MQRLGFGTDDVGQDERVGGQRRVLGKRRELTGVGGGLRRCKQGGQYLGTSMATARVAGVAALLAARGRTDENVVDVLKSTARKPGTDLGGVYEPAYGYGIVDAQAAVADPQG